MKILITGAAGYIGSHTLKKLLETDHEVTTIDNLENGYRPAILGGNFIQCDLRNKDDLSKAFKENHFDAVIHFAAYASVPDSVSDPAKYYLNNLIGGLNLLECMRENRVDKIVFSSSAAVYGEPTQALIAEDDPKFPTNPYGATKLYFEQILQSYDRAYGIKSVSLRYFCAAGADPEGKIGEAHNPETHVIPVAILTALGHREQFKIFGDDYNTEDGTGVRDFIHVSDLAEIHSLGLKHLIGGGETKAYNCGISKGYSVKEIVSAVEKISGKKINVKIVDRRPGDPSSLIANAEKVKKELGFVSRFSDLDNIVSTSYNWFKDHPNGY
jgi:UDP-glucose 4-epimerase